MKKCLLVLLLSTLGFGESCTYHTWTWDTVKKKSVGHRKVVKLRSELDSSERGFVKGCSVCEEDQVELRIPQLPPVRICKVFAESMRRALEQAHGSGFPIQTLIGYRVGKSKGQIDKAGLRTEFSNHSYGTAIDINAEKNGLYDNCVSFGPQCRLLRGGNYIAASSGAITKESTIYRVFRENGFRWGGEIDGRQKDFMHFSLDGM